MASFILLGLVICGTISRLSDAKDTVQLGDLDLRVCRESDASFTWKLPSETEEIYSIGFKYIPLPTLDDPNPATYPLLSKDGDGDWKLSTAIKRYTGRLFSTSLSSFSLDNILTSDRGTYELFVNAQGAIYEGKAQLKVFAEDNYFPTAVGNTSNVAETTPDGATQYRYKFSQPDNSPVEGVEMFASDPEGHMSEHKSCFFGENSTMCDIVFTMVDLKGLSGTLVLEVEPKYETGTPGCKNMNNFYNLMITIVAPPGLSNGTIGGMVVAAVVVVVCACVLPLLLTRQLQNRNKHIPLLKGLSFVQYCTSTIQNYDTYEDLKGIYRENKPKSQSAYFIEVYQKKKGELGEEYENERGLMASAIKLYLKEEKTPWLPLNMQKNITDAEKDYMSSRDEFDVAAVKKVLNQSQDKESTARRDIIKHLLYHFYWLSEERKSFPNNCNVVDLRGLVICLSPNFFKEAHEEIMNAKSDEGAVARTQKANEVSERHRAFMSHLITNVSQIFPNSENDTIVEADMTQQRLLGKDNDNNIV